MRLSSTKLGAGCALGRRHPGRTLCRGRGVGGGAVGGVPLVAVMFERGGWRLLGSEGAQVVVKGERLCSWSEERGLRRMEVLSESKRGLYM